MRASVMTRVLDLVDELRNVADVGSFADRSLVGLNDLVPSDELTFNDIDFDTRTVRFVRQIPTPVSDDGELFFDLSHQLPTCMTGDPGEPGVRRGSDVLSRRELRRLEAYEVLMRPFDYDLKVALAAPTRTSRAFMFARIDRDFTDRERDVLGLLLPHLDAAYRRVRVASRLTDRERQILTFVASGMTNREIGDALHLSALTIRTHLEHVFEKLGVRTRTAAAAAVSRQPATVDEPRATA